MLSHLGRVWLFVTLWTLARQAPLVHGILQTRMLEWAAMPSSRGSFWPKGQTPVSYVSWICRQILYHSHHSGVYMSHCCCCCYVASVVSDSVRPHRRQPTRLPHPWDSPGKNTGVACHFLLQCMKVKSEREVAQSCPTLRNPMDCSPSGSSVHGIFQARVLEWGAVAFSDTSHYFTPNLCLFSTSVTLLLCCKKFIWTF